MMESGLLKKLLSRWQKPEAAPVMNAPVEATDRRRASRAVYQRPITVLIVDDSRTVVHSIRKMLEQSGYLTLEASDGATGVEVAKARKPDLIIMDIVMPGINGFQATRLIRKDPATEQIPIVIISGNEQAAEELWGKRVGANDFIPKPITRGNLFPTIERWLRHLQVIAR